MNILMLSPVYPIPTDSGDKRRILAILRRISQHHKVTFLSLIESESEKAGNQVESWLEYRIPMRPRRRIWVALKSVFSMSIYREVRFRNREYREFLSSLLEKEHYDVIWVHFLNMATYLYDYLKTHRQTPILLLDQHNVDEQERWSMALKGGNIAWRAFALWDAVKARRLQRYWYSKFHVIASVSSDDLNLTTKYLSDTTQVWLAPNGVDTQEFIPIARSQSGDSARRLVFVGSLDVAMNQDAAIWFAKKILPQIQANLPEVRFLIVGRNPPAVVNQLKTLPRVEVISNVKEVQPFFHMADVFVIPSRFGGGTKIKTLEAMAMGLPIVSTTVGAQGLLVKQGEHMYITGNPFEFAQYCIELILDKGKAEELGRQARQLVVSIYEWDSIVTEMELKLMAMMKSTGIQD